jgi:hypothetical protein
MTTTRQTAYARYTEAKSPQSDGGEKITLGEAKHTLAALISDDGKLDFRETEDALVYQNSRFDRPSLKAYAKNFIAKYGMKDFERAAQLEGSEHKKPVALSQLPGKLQTALSAAVKAVNAAATKQIKEEAAQYDPADYEAPNEEAVKLEEVYAADEKIILGYQASQWVHFPSWDLEIKCAVAPDGTRLFLVTNWD